MLENARDDTKKMLVATKADLDWAVTPSEAQRLADQHSMPFIITSALKNSNVQESFLNFGEMVLLSKRQDSEVLRLTDKKRSRKRCICK